MSYGYRRNRYKNRNRSTYHSYNSQDNGTGFGEIEFHWKDGATPSVKFNKIAHSGRSELLMVSLVAESQRIKQIRAALAPTGNKANNANRVSATAGGVKTNIPGREAWEAGAPGNLNPSAEGYLCYQHKLGFGLCHALFVTKAPGFLLVLSEEALWQELNTTRFTTPLLREWMPYLEQQLRDCNRLEDAHVYGCRCGILTATTKKLDEIVIAGLTSGEIVIPEEEPALAAAVA
jgi:hypothetical protein